MNIRERNLARKKLVEMIEAGADLEMIRLTARNKQTDVWGLSKVKTPDGKKAMTPTAERKTIERCQLVARWAEWKMNGNIR